MLRNFIFENYCKHLRIQVHTHRSQQSSRKVQHKKVITDVLCYEVEVYQNLSIL